MGTDPEPRESPVPFPGQGAESVVHTRRPQAFSHLFEVQGWVLLVLEPEGELLVSSASDLFRQRPVIRPEPPMSQGLHSSNGRTLPASMSASISASSPESRPPGAESFASCSSQRRSRCSSHHRSSSEYWPAGSRVIAAVISWTVLTMRFVPSGPVSGKAGPGWFSSAAYRSKQCERRWRRGEPHFARCFASTAPPVMPARSPSLLATISMPLVVPGIA